MRMGVETEFGIANAWHPAKAQAIQNRILATHPWMPSDKSGVFISNGARVYVDLGKHNEYATPEVESPSELVIHEMAGRRIMTDAAAACGFTLLCSNIDPVSGNTWGSHENYECDRAWSPEERAALNTHLVTRIIYTGAGGIDPFFAGIRPLLSPRAARIVGEFERQGVVRKSLVFEKPDDYGNGHRLHVFCGESLLSRAASYLKYAATALVVSAIDARWPVRWPRPGLEPLRVLRTINRDVSLSHRIPLADGRRLTALELQRHLMSEIRPHAEDRIPWGHHAVRCWEQALDEIEQDSSAARDLFDWMFTLDRLSELAAASRIGAEAVAEFNARIRAVAHVKEWADWPAQRASHLRDQAVELYLRLHMLGKDSLHERLARSRSSTNDMKDISERDIEEAMHTPPAGRASYRAELIRRKDEFPEATLAWNVMYERKRNRMLPLPDGHLSDWDQRWFAMEDDGQDQDPELLFRQGHYRDTLLALLPQVTALRTGTTCAATELICLSHMRSGMPFDLDAALAALTRSGVPRFQVLALELFCRIHEGLIPPGEKLMELICEGDSIIEAEPRDSYDRVKFIQSKAWVQASMGDEDGALGLLHHLIEDERRAARPRLLARTRCYAGELHRRRGEMQEARMLGYMAFRTHQREDMRGDMAMHSLPLLIRLAPTDELAESQLIVAERHARTTANTLALAHLRFLRARRLRQPDGRESVVALVQGMPTLSTCPLARRMVSKWDEWCSGSSAIGPGDYWGLA